jgi:hypothetical protein
MKIRPVGAEWFQSDRGTDGRTEGRTDGQRDGRTDRGTDGRTDMTKLVAFRNFAKAHKTAHLPIIQQVNDLSETASLG